MEGKGLDRDASQLARTVGASGVRPPCCYYQS